MAGLPQCITIGQVPSFARFAGRDPDERAMTMRLLLGNFRGGDDAPLNQGASISPLLICAAPGLMSLRKAQPCNGGFVILCGGTPEPDNDAHKNGKCEREA
jgi:hypothetical protein